MTNKVKQAALALAAIAVFSNTFDVRLERKNGEFTGYMDLQPVPAAVIGGILQIFKFLDEDDQK